MDKVKKNILNQVANKKISINEGKELLKELTALNLPNVNKDMAIVGMSGSFSGTNDIEEFWEVIKQRKPTIRELPEGRIKDVTDFLKNKSYGEAVGISSERPDDAREITTKAGYLNEIDKFDAQFFNISPVEAINMDPYQRIVLEKAWSALEDAGYHPESLKGEKVGVFIGRETTNRSLYQDLSEPHQMMLTGTWESLTASRVSYALDFKGPCMLTDTACSSGLGSVHLAIQSIQNGECEMALAGGINLCVWGSFKGKYTYGANFDSVEAVDEQVKTFDANANGTLWGEGVGLVVVKPLDKAIAAGDNIQAVIKASGVNNDGASQSITAPNAKTQEELIVETWKKAGIDVESIGYIEAHGTGTILGDPIEIKGLSNAFKHFTDKKQFCAIGSSKTNFGHMVAASGIASLIKVVKVLREKKLPPNINFSTPNPYINFLDSALYVSNELNDWESKETRRAALSSFGFCRTNYHMLLEEAPTFTSKKENDCTGFLTVSAKSEEALNNYLLKYRTYINCSTNALEDICYTSNVGRGHYQHRSIFLADTREKLLKRLDQALFTKSGDGFQKAYYKIVNDNLEVDANKGEITIGEQNRLSDSMLKLVEGYSGKREISADVTEIMKLYVKGAHLDWSALYRGKDSKRVSVPTYPFERTRYWTKPKQSLVATHTEKLSPLVHRKISSNNHSVRFESILNSESTWELKDHKINEIAVLPGTAYLEMIHQVASEELGMKTVTFKNLYFLNPLIVAEGDKLITIVVKDIETAPKFSIYSEDDEGEVVYHVEGTLDQVSEVEIPERIDIQALIKNEKGFNYYEQNGIEDETGFFTFGKHWQQLKSIWERKDFTIARLQLTSDIANEVKSYNMHTSQMDNAANLLLSISEEIKGTYLPYSYKKMVVYRNLTDTVYSLIKPDYEKDPTRETVTFDITITDDYGNVLIEISNYVIKRVNQNNALINQATPVVKLNWIPYDLNLNEAFDSPSGNWLTVGFDHDSHTQAVDEFKKEGLNVSSFYLPETKAFNSEQEAGRLIEAIVANKTTGLVLLTDYTKPSIDYHCFEEVNVYKQASLDLYFYLIKQLVSQKVGLKDGIKVILKEAHCVDTSEKALNPLATSLSSLALVSGSEYRSLPVSIIDTDDETPLSLLTDALIQNKEKEVLAVRKSQWFIRQLEQHQNEQEAVQLERDPSGVYIITGGLGGVGFEIATHMLNEPNVKLILIGRTPIDASKTEHIDSAKQSKIQFLKENEDRVEYIATDISNQELMSELREDVLNRYGAISGIYHAAGVAGNGFLMNKTYEQFNEVLSPKLLGTLNLLTFIPENTNAFMLLFSSINSVMNDEGQGDYSAANAFLDTLSYKSHELNKRILTVNWPGWKNTGMMKDFSLDDGGLFNVIEVDKGLEYMETIISRSLIDHLPVIPTKLNLSMLNEVMNSLPFEVSPSLKASMEKISKKTIESGAFDFNEVQIKGTSTINDTLKKLSTIFGNVLGLEEIDVTLSFQELGGNSLMATQLLRGIEQHLNFEIDLADIFSYPSVLSLSAYLQEKEVDHPEQDEAQEEISDELLEYLKAEVEDESLLAELNLEEAG
ncbi:MAG: SDR family NAD(P)-dependent oxidoreductase [Defluviitaleaceae bacterium]|nr:SDR family NAD(P)-dependent oxidoreductase [Defluviitaleaceae bacterium]